MKQVLFIFFLFANISSSAQLILNNKIIEEHGNNKIPYAEITIKNKLNVGTTSNLSGCFSLNCNYHDTLIIQCVGYKTKSTLVSEVMDVEFIELAKDTINIKEITILPINAYNILLQARDSTIAHQIKTFQGICRRDDKLSFNRKLERISEAEIIFKTKEIKKNKNKTEYWLKSNMSSSYKKTSGQPYLSYPNTIPLILSSINTLSPDEILNSKCYLYSNTDSIITIKVKLAKPTKNLINECIYNITTDNQTIKRFEYNGNFTDTIQNDGSRIRTLTKIELNYKTVSDSILLDQFNYQIKFYKKDSNPNELWEYTAKMKILQIEDDFDFQDYSKLRKTDYLLYKQN